MTREAAKARLGQDKLRGFMGFRYGAKNWDKEGRFVARIEATPNGPDVGYVVRSLKPSARYGTVRVTFV